ncbi:hypothetical protein B7486_05430 [cyanobacterium TDX16]|nr:hypothetical protein B7486_05430 [cyanobacterium TDX16]
MRGKGQKMSETGLGLEAWGLGLELSVSVTSGAALRGMVGIISMYLDLLRVRAGFAGSSQARLKPAGGREKKHEWGWACFHQLKLAANAGRLKPTVWRVTQWGYMSDAQVTQWERGVIVGSGALARGRKGMGRDSHLSGCEKGISHQRWRIARAPTEVGG